MQHRRLIASSILSVGAALRIQTIPSSDVPEPDDALQTDVADSLPFVPGQNASRCDFQGMVYGDVDSIMVSKALYSQDACKGAMPEPGSDDAKDLDSWSLGKQSAVLGPGSYDAQDLNFTMLERASVDAQDLDPWNLVQRWTSRLGAADAEPGEPRVATVSAEDAQAAAFMPFETTPTAACIAVLPSGHDTLRRVQRLIDNFEEQTYEGGMQLIIVADEARESEEALLRVADGVAIKAVHAAVDGMDLAALFHLGVAAADDADVLARWDWNAWHHPDRLALQIRAMALTSRPASLLRTWTSTEARREALGDPTLVGEKEWMKRYWYPGQREEQLQAHLRHFVEVELTNLIVSV